jgi:mannose-1-phosphate guanylyltransferase
VTRPGENRATTYDRLVQAPVVVIMAGGAGTRFWPAGTAGRPKQFLSLVGDKTLLRQSFERARLLAPPERILVLTNARLVTQVRDQLPELDPEQIVGEPARKDTAAAVCLAALLAEDLFGTTVMVVLTADHVIGPDGEFVRTVNSAVAEAARGSALYTIGIPPTEPSSAYGYLERGRPVATGDGVQHHQVASFREKPDKKTAEEFLASGSFYWNSGMFVWRTDSILCRFVRLLPAHLAALGPVITHSGTSFDDAALANAFSSLEPVSIDYGIMEKADDVFVAAATFSWSDVGGWEALGEYLPVDPLANRHNCRTALREARDNVVYSTDPSELVALIGVEGLVVVRAGTRTLVVPRERAEDLKALVASLEEEDR